VPVETYPTLPGYVLQFWGPGPNGRTQYIVIDGIDIDARGITATATFSCGNLCNGATDDGPRHIKFQNLEVRNAVKSCFSEPGWNDETIDTDYYFINTKIHHCGAPFDTTMINGVPARLNPLARFRHAFYGHTGGKHMIDSEAYANSGTGVGFVGVNNTVSGSYIHDNAAQGIYVAGTGWVIENNVVADNGVSGGIEIYVLGDGNHLIRNNTVIRSNPSFGSKAFWVNSSNITIENNIIIGSHYGIWNESWGGAPHTVRNNLVVSITPGREIYDAYAEVVRMVQKDNILGQDPKFVNPAGGDFHLQAGSPAINAGFANGLMTDKTGNARSGAPDIGAYEFGN
jgi:parallel beta-helix repeat protein